MPSPPNWLTLGTIADICGIIGLVFSIGIWRMTDTLKNQIIVYKKTQKDILINLRAQRDSIRLDDVYTLSVRSELRTELYGMVRNFSAILSLKDRAVVHLTIHRLKHAKNANTEIICTNLDYIIARFQKKELPR